MDEPNKLKQTWELDYKIMLRAKHLYNNLLYMGNGTMTTDIDGAVTFPENFCNLVDSKDELTQ